MQIRCVPVALDVSGMRQTGIDTKNDSDTQRTAASFTFPRGKVDAKRPDEGRIIKVYTFIRKRNSYRCFFCLLRLE